MLSKDPPRPPQAFRTEHKISFLGEDRYDPYYWLRDMDRQKEKILSYLKQENLYTKKVLSPVKGLRRKLFEEMKTRVPKEDQSVPFQEGQFYYYERYETQSEHPIICRKKDSLKGKEEILLDANLLGKNQSYFKLGSWAVNKDQDLLAYTVDLKGRRFYALFIKDLKTGEVLRKIENITNNFVWSKKQAHLLLYTRLHPKTLRWETIQALNIKTGKKSLIYQEGDKSHSVYVSNSLSGSFIFINSSSKENSQVFLLPSSSPVSTAPRLFEKKKSQHKYWVEHAGSYFFILSNWKGSNFQIFRTPDEKKISKKHWRSFIPHRREIYIEDFLVFETHLVLLIRKDGFREMEVIARKVRKGGSQNKRFVIPFDEQNHYVSFEENRNYKSPFFKTGILFHENSIDCDGLLF